MSIPRFASQRRSERGPATGLKTEAILLGQVRWFGGFNNSTGRENHYGFIEAEGIDFFVHRSAVLSSKDSMIEGAEVLFHRLEDCSGKPAATAVRILSEMSDDELVALLNETPNPSPDLVLTVTLMRKELAPFRNEVFRALIALGAEKPNSSLLGRFWNYFSPSGPRDRFFALAPEAVKSQVCKKHYSALRHSLLDLLGRDKGPPTAITAQEIYEDLDDHDRRIASIWAGSKEDAVVAQMLSARAAEKAVARLYRGAGAIVDDVAITQLDRTGCDWLTHDLNVDRTIPIDVKNARRPINSRRFYVEHTVPRFKLDRSGSHVRIAGVLSPYLQKRFIEKPSSAEFRIDDIVLLGETSRPDIGDLIIKYRSPHFEVVRGNERTFPNWVFGHPERWYPGLRDQMQCARELCRDIPDDDWRYIFDPDEAGEVVAALCVIRVPLPSTLEDRLSKHQATFCKKLQRNLKEIPDVPDIFLAVMSHFVEAVIDDWADYSPAIYTPILFPKRDHVVPLRATGPSFPLGAIDPLNLVVSLLKTLTSLWEKRSHTALKEFSSFRFGGLGLLQARRNADVEWTTILAYCGGSEYYKGEDGEILLSDAGRPRPKGKCGHTPLVLGNHQTCPNCRKLLCDMCGFCSVACRDQVFRALAGGSNSARDRNRVAPIKKNEFPKDSGRTLEAPPWELVPLYAYEHDFR